MQAILALPHFVVLYALGILSGVVAFVTWFVVLFTGKLPTGLAGVQVMYLRYSNRVTTFFRSILAIPHFVALFFVGIAASVAWVIGAFAVLFTGRWPEGLRRFVVGSMRWTLRVNAYTVLLTDDYPPFSLD